MIDQLDLAEKASNLDVIWTCFDAVCLLLALRATYRHQLIHQRIKERGINGTSRAITFIRLLGSQGMVIRQLCFIVTGFLAMMIPDADRVAIDGAVILLHDATGYLIIAAEVTDFVILIWSEVLWRHAASHRRANPEEVIHVE